MDATHAPDRVPARLCPHRRRDRAGSAGAVEGSGAERAGSERASAECAGTESVDAERRRVGLARGMRQRRQGARLPRHQPGEPARDPAAHRRRGGPHSAGQQEAGDDDPAAAGRAGHRSGDLAGRPGGGRALPDADVHAGRLRRRRAGERRAHRHVAQRADAEGRVPQCRRPDRHGDHAASRLRAGARQDQVEAAQRVRGSDPATEVASFMNPGGVNAGGAVLFVSGDAIKAAFNVPGSRATRCYEGSIRAVRVDPGSAGARKAWILVATILGSAIAYVDESVVNVALPAMQSDLESSVTVIQWVINAYTLFLSALLLLGGAAGDQFGRRRVFLTGVAVFAAASLACAFSQSTTQLIIARAVQGIGAALLVPCSLAIIGASFDETERGKAIGTWAASSAVAGALGPLLGGWIVDHVTWRWIFLINPFLAAATMWITGRYVPESFADTSRDRLDWPGALLALAGLGG